MRQGMILGLLLLFTSVGWGQQLSLKIVDEDGKAIEGVQILLQGADERHFALSDELGKAQLPTLEGQLELYHLNYKNLVQPLKANQTELQLSLEKQENLLNEVVVTGQGKGRKRREALRHIEVIDQKRIKSQAAQNLRDLLQQELNIQVSQDAALGSQISMQGLSGQKVKILVDMVPVIGRTDGNIDLNQLNLSEIERVEIVQGPMAVAYGTDALAGTINLISKKSTGKELKARLGYYGESAGRHNLDAALNYQHFRLQLGRNFFAGFHPNPRERNLLWNPKEQYFGRFSAQKRWGNTLLRFNSQYFDETLLNPGSITREIVSEAQGNFWHQIAVDEHYRTRRADQSLFLTQLWDKDQKLEGFIAFNDFQRRKETLRKNLSTGEEFVLANAEAQDTARFLSLSSRSFYHQHWPQNKIGLQVGYDFNYEINRGARIEGQQQDLLDVALFAKAEWQWRKLALEPGLRWAHNSRFEAPLISSLALKYQLHPRWQWRASYGQGFRAPSLKELYFFFVDANHNILGNPDLKAETSHNWQSSITWLGDSSELRLNTFYHRLNNEIRLIAVQEPDDNDPRGLFRNQNLDRSASLGWELSARLKRGAWQFNAGWVQTGLRNALSFSEGLNGDFQFFGQGRAGLSYRWKALKDLQSHLFANYTAPRKDLVADANGDLRFARFPGFGMVDFSVEKEIPAWRLSLQVGVKNLLDVENVGGNALAGGGAHSSGSGQMMVGYGRFFFTQIQFRL